VKVTNNNVKGLSQLWEEFRFRDLAAQLLEFRESGNFTEDVVLLSALKKHLLAMEDQMPHGKWEIASLGREVSRGQKSLEEGIRTEAESASRRANAVEQNVAEVRNEVENVREALREVRGLAKRVQTKAASQARGAARG
jgi:chromosome segregation ATPase